MAWSIKDWDKTFEDRRSREIADLRWVRMPTRQDSEAFMALMRSKGGASAYGVFCALVCMSARCTTRGTLADDRGSITNERIAVRLGLTVDEVRDATQLLASKEIGWLVGTADVAPSARRPRAVRAPSARRQGADVAPQRGEERRGEEITGEESTKTPPSRGSAKPPTAECVSPETIYSLYPRKVGKAVAVKAIAKAIKIIASTEAMTTDQAAASLKVRTQAFAESTLVRTTDPQYIPHPATWFNRGSYGDDPREWDRDATKSNGTANHDNTERPVVKTAAEIGAELDACRKEWGL